MSTDEQQPTQAEAGTSVLMEVSNTMVRLYKSHYGHGPKRARSYWAGPDALVCILDNTLATADRNLLRLGGHERLRETRTVVQYGLIDEYCRPVERLTGRTLAAFHSSCDAEAGGQSVEMFVFHPASYNGPSRIARAEPDETL